MAKPGQFTPAIFWRAFFIVTLLTGSVFSAQPAAPGQLAQVGKPDAAEAARLLGQFRGAGIAGEYYAEFELRELPRRGEETVLRGRLWGGRNEQGTVLRIVVADATGREHRLLVQSGDRAAVWRVTNGRVGQVPMAAALEPLVPGVELAAFDLQMPFLFWPGASVESIQRVHGRPAFEFVFIPPAAFAAQHPELAKVRSFFDTQFNAPMQTELLGPGNRVTKTWTLGDLKKVGEQTIPKSFEVRNEVTRDKTRMTLTAVALSLELASSVFAPATLTDELAPPSPGRIVRISP